MWEARSLELVNLIVIDYVIRVNKFPITTSHSKGDVKNS